MPEYVPHKKISLKNHPEFSEKWLQQQIAREPAILGLGELDVKDVERPQLRAGRLDLLLYEPETNTRYEVELQLGATDEPHIIRTIEYWDIERRRFPQYEHIAVIVAEEIAARFFNVISLFNGFIPLIAIQVNAIEVNGAVTLVFTRVLDQMPLGLEEDEDEEPKDRTYWESHRGSPASLALADRMVEFAQEVEPGVRLKYNKHYIGLAKDGVAMNFASFRPRRQHLIAEFKNPRSDELTARLEDAGLALLAKDRWSTYRIALTAGNVEQQPDLLREMFELSRNAYGGVV